MPRMHALIPLLLLLPAMLSGCAIAAGAVAGADAASVTVFGRGIVDGGVSAVTGKNCSIVRLDRGLDYCAPRERLPADPVFCTQTLGSVMCWSNPDAFVQPPHALADTPPLTSDQSRSVLARWPKSLNLGD